LPISAGRLRKRAAESGERLNTPSWFSAVEQRGGVPRRGHLVLIAGVPNSGKSAIAQALVAEVNAPTLYFSADQDAFQSYTKLAAALTGEQTAAVAHNILNGVGEDYYDDVLSKSNIYFCTDSKPSLDDVGAELDAFVDTWDEYPEIIVIDTLKNIDGNGEKQDDEWIISELHSLARRTRACVILLAHMSRANVKDSTKPPGIKELINKLDALPDLVLMVAYEADAETLWVAVGKTREGRADPEANHPVSLKADFDRMAFGISAAPAWGGWDSEG